MLQKISTWFRGSKSNTNFSKTPSSLQSLNESAIIEWNNVDLTIHNAESFGVFESNILKLIRHFLRSPFQQLQQYRN